MRKYREPMHSRPLVRLGRLGYVLVMLLSATIWVRARNNQTGQAQKLRGGHVAWFRGRQIRPRLSQHVAKARLPDNAIHVLLEQESLARQPSRRSGHFPDVASVTVVQLL